MRVNDSNAGNIGGAQYESTRATGGVGPGNRGEGNRRADASGTDDVQLSGLAGLLKSASGDSTERAQKTQRLAQLVQSGSYQVDPDAVSRRLVDEMLGTSTS